MTVQEKIDKLKSITIPPRNAPKPGQFDLEGQFSAAAVTSIRTSATAVMAINAAHAGGKFLPIDKGSDDVAEETSSSSLGVAHDLIGCVLAGEEGTGACNHSNVDHIATARQCLENYSNDQSARDRHRGDAGIMRASRIRFVN